MSEAREVLGVWAYEGMDRPRNRDHKKAREKWITDYFGDPHEVPSFIWCVEFWRTGTVSDGMTLHCYAANEEGRRHMTWVKAYDTYGHAVNVKLVATLPPRDYPVQSLPPEWLLLNNPKETAGQ